MTLLRLMVHFGIRRGLALWLLPEITKAQDAAFQSAWNTYSEPYSDTSA